MLGALKPVNTRIYKHTHNPFNKTSTTYSISRDGAPFVLFIVFASTKGIMVHVWWSRVLCDIVELELRPKQLEQGAPLWWGREDALVLGN